MSQKVSEMSSSDLSQPSSVTLNYDSIWVTQPQPLIVLAGMDDLHQVIVDNIPKQNKLRIQSIPLGHAFPVKNPTRSFEGYEPAGILKINWMKKRLQVVPSLVVILMEWLDGQDDSNEANLNNCVSLFKGNNSTRLMPVLVVAVRHRTPAEEDPQLEDRVVRIGKKQGLENKVFVLSTGDLKTSLRRLESVCFDLVCAFCRKEAQRISRYRSKVDKKTQVKLSVRHNFKIAFYYEMVGDAQEALKHYLRCSTFLKQLHCSGETLLEVKWIAYILMVKICGFTIRLQTLHAALAYFQAHLSDYQSQTPFAELEFLDHHWTCSQYYAFGRILQTIPTLRNLQYNPGYFYQTAASFASKRKQAYLTARNVFVKRKGISLAPNRQLLNPKFVAQPTLLKELESKYGVGTQGWSAAVTESLVYLETRTNHHEKVLEYLHASYDCFKKERAQKMFLHIAFQMGVEHFSEGKFSQAKRFFDRISNQYRKEGWFQLLTCCLMYAYKCARRLAFSREVLLYSFELMCVYAKTNSTQKRNVLQDVFSILSDPSTAKADPAKSAGGDSGETINATAAPVTILITQMIQTHS